MIPPRQKTKVVVTGGSGFIGTNLVESYVLSGDEVLNFDVEPPRNPRHRHLWRAIDCLNGSDLGGALESASPDYIFHLAARTDLGGQTDEDYAANTTGTANLCAAVPRCRGLKHVVFASSLLVCRPGYRPKHETDYLPTTAYGRSKMISEQIVRAAPELGCRWTIVRPTHIWGPWFRAPYRDFFTMVGRGFYIHPRVENLRKAFGFVGNVVYQLKRIAEGESADHLTLYVTDYEPLEVGCWAEAIAREMKVRKPLQAPLSLLRAVAKIGDFAGTVGGYNAPLTSFRLNNLLTETVVDLGMTKTICGPLPYTPQEGVRMTVEWLRCNPET